MIKHFKVAFLSGSELKLKNKMKALTKNENVVKTDHRRHAEAMYAEELCGG